MRRFVPGHCPDYSRPGRAFWLCQCGHAETYHSGIVYHCRYPVAA